MKFHKFLIYATCNINKSITRYVRCLSVFIINFAEIFREYLLSLIRILRFENYGHNHNARERMSIQFPHQSALNFQKRNKSNMALIKLF